MLRDACKKKIAHILSFRDRGGGAAKIELSRISPKMSDFFVTSGRKKSLIFSGFRDKGVGGGGAIFQLSRKDKI